MPVLVRDSYIDGRGSMQASMFGIYPLADQTDKRELNLGALQRLLGEAVWLPTLLLPSRRGLVTARRSFGLRHARRPWQQRHALVRIRSRRRRAAISGERYKEDGGAYTLQTWQIQCDEYRERSGIVVPTRCEVAWINNGVRELYWRGRITSIEYNSTDWGRIEPCEFHEWRCRSLRCPRSARAGRRGTAETGRGSAAESHRLQDLVVRLLPAVGRSHEDRTASTCRRWTSRPPTCAR